MKDPSTPQRRTTLGNLAQAYRDAAPYMGLGATLAGTIVLFFLIGRWLDAKFGTSPTLTIIGSFVGLIGGFYNFLKTISALLKKQSSAKKQS